MKTQKSLVYVVLEGELSVMLSVFPFLFLPLHKRSIFPSGVTFKGSLCCVFSLDKVLWVIFSSIHQSFSIPFFFFFKSNQIKNINLANTTLLLRTCFRKKNYLKISGSKKSSESHNISFVNYSDLLQGKRGRNVWMQLVSSNWTKTWSIHSSSTFLLWILSFELCASIHRT